MNHLQLWPSSGHSGDSHRVSLVVRGLAVYGGILMRRLLNQVLGIVAAGVLVCWRATLRIRIERDPRPGLRAEGRRYIYAILHAQQLSFILLSDDVPILAMVSASRDGDWLVPLCRVRRIIPVRGSTGKRGVDKGGRAALAKLADGVRKGLPALLA